MTAKSVFYKAGNQGMAPMKILSVVLLLSLLLTSQAATPAHAVGSIMVDTTHDQDNTDLTRCSLREAITAANTDATYGGCPAGSGADTITFSLSGTITLDSSLPTVTDSTVLTIDGSGQAITISGANLYRVLRVNGSATLNHLTIANGNSGGILNSGTLLTVTNSTLLDNRADNGGGGIWNSTISTLIVANSTFSGNKATTYSSGGGIFNYGGTVNITNSTFSGNTAEGYGGGIINVNSGTSATLTIRNSTFSGNSADAAVGGIDNMPGNTLTLYNTIVAHSTTGGIPGGNCGGTITNGGNNIDDGTTCGWGFADNSMSNTDPLLDVLTGSPAYFPLSRGSAAIDAGNDAVCAAAPVNNESQNGLSRPQGAHCDIGAFEMFLRSLTVTSAHGTVNRDNPGPYYQGDAVQLTAVPAAGWTFANWSGDATGATNPVSVTMDSDKAVIANYIAITYSISGSVRVASATLTYTDGTVKHATSAADGSYALTVSYNWSGTVKPTKAGCIFTPISRPYSHVLANKTAQNYSVNCTFTYQSSGAQDGWVLESGENTNVGGSLNVASNVFNLGDNAVRKQYRGILSFNTSALPDTAVITQATLKLRRQSITGGGNPFSIFQGLMIDMRKGFFFTAPALQIADFQAAASKPNLGPFNLVPSGTLYTVTLPLTAFPYINKLATNGGLTQLRLRFKLDDNNNAIANFISFYSGSAASASRPVLTIRFHVP